MTRGILGRSIDSSYGDFMFNTKKHDGSKHSWVVLGPSGGGKEGRGKELVRRFELEGKPSSGDLFRGIIGNLGPHFGQILGRMKEIGKEIGEDSLKRVLYDASEVEHIFKTEGIEPYDFDKVMGIMQSVNGLFVQDHIYRPMVQGQLDEYKDQQIVFDGHIRTANQADFIYQDARDRGIFINGALLVHSDLNILLPRTVGRLSCPSCASENKNSDYNLTFKEGDLRKPINIFSDEESGLDLGYCPTHTDQVLKRRSDDEPEKVACRLKEYEENIGGVLEHISKHNVPVHIVTGMLEPYSKQAMQQTITDSLNSDALAIYRSFGM